MNIDKALAKIAADHNLERIDVGRSNADCNADWPYHATAWGVGIGAHGCTHGDGSTASEAIAAALSSAAERRALNIPAIEVELAA